MLIAVDTNVLFDQIFCEADVMDALDVIGRRLHPRFIVTPTVLHELAFKADDEAECEEDREVAVQVLESLLEWGYEPLNFIPVGHGIVEQIGFKLRSAGVLPDVEENDSYVIAEAALTGCAMLLSSDWHMLDAQQHPQFRPILKGCDVEGDNLVIARPRTIVRQYFNT